MNDRPVERHVGRAGDSGESAGGPPERGAAWANVLARVLAVQLVALILLWLLQTRYAW